MFYWEITLTSHSCPNHILNLHKANTFLYKPRLHFRKFQYTKSLSLKFQIGANSQIFFYAIITSFPNLEDYCCSAAVL